MIQKKKKNHSFFFGKKDHHIEWVGSFSRFKVILQKVGLGFIWVYPCIKLCVLIQEFKYFIATVIKLVIKID
jgi:hypothetical protein